MNRDHSAICTICSSPSVKTGFELNGYELNWCRQCNFYFSPEAFDKLPDYDDAYTSPAYIRNQVEVLRLTKDKSIFGRIATYRVFFENHPAERQRTLLDVGCGVGRFCHAAHAAGYSVTGIDISKKAIDIGAVYAPFSMRCESLESIARRRCVFDTVTSFEVMEHLSAPLEFLRLIRTILSEGGEFFFTVPNWDCPKIRKAKSYDAVPPFHVNFFTQNACHALLEATGFSSIRTGVINVDPMPDSHRSFPKWMVKRIIGGPRNLGLWASGIR